MKPSDIAFKTFCAALLLALASCSNTSSSTDAAKSSAKQSSSDNSNTQVAALEGVDSKDATAVSEENQKFSKIITKKGTVTNRGGYIKILVNKEPITNYEIQRRVQFLKLRRIGGNRKKTAENELVEQALKLSESKRLRTYASDAQVDEAYARFAKNNRATPAQLSKQLAQLGVGASHFKEFIRTQISWGGSLQRFYNAKNNTQSNERDVVTGLRKSGKEKPELTEYAFKQVIFVVPAAKKTKSAISARKREALAFRQRFPGCEQASTAIKDLRDVSIINRQRVLEPELPERWKDKILSADGKGTTTAIETDRGVEFIAICSKRQVNDDRAAVVAHRAEEFTDLNKQTTKLEKEFLDQLRAAAIIVYQ